VTLVRQRREALDKLALAFSDTRDTSKTDAIVRAQDGAPNQRNATFLEQS